MAMVSLCVVAFTSCVSAGRRDPLVAGPETAVAEVTLHPNATEVMLDVTVTVRGRAARDVVGVRLDSWGGSGRGQMSSATVNGTPTTIDEDGTIRFGSRESRQVVRYRLRVHPAGGSSEWRLLPHRAGDAVVFFTMNVIPALVLTGDREQFIEMMRLVPPSGFQTITASSACSDAGCRRVPENGVAVFVPQTSPHLPLLTSATASILDLTGQGFGPSVRELADRIVRERPLQPSTPVQNASRLLVVERSFEEGVSSGTWTQQGIRLALAGAPPLDVAHRKIVAHELLHDSVNPDRLGEDAPLWMYEGFTEYLAAWTLAASGVESPVAFAARMREHEIRATTNIARHGARFGEQKGAAHRESADETLAYSGGTIFAFAVDAALRACGADLATVVAEASKAQLRLKREPESSRAATAFREALAARGLVSLYDSLVGGGRVPRINSALVAAGFVVEHSDASLQYLGFALAGDRSLFSTDAQVVSAVDPDGPAAAAGLQRGDTIVSAKAMLRSDPPWIAPAVDRRYDAGLAEIASGAPSVAIRVRRAEGVRDLVVKPRSIQGGYREVPRPAASGAMAFFRPPVANASCPR